jgi:hypothetical protein
MSIAVLFSIPLERGSILTFRESRQPSPETVSKTFRRRRERRILSDFVDRIRRQCSIGLIDIGEDDTGENGVVLVIGATDEVLDQILFVGEAFEDVQIDSRDQTNPAARCLVDGADLFHVMVDRRSTEIAKNVHDSIQRRKTKVRTEVFDEFLHLREENSICWPAEEKASYPSERFDFLRRAITEKVGGQHTRDVLPFEGVFRDAVKQSERRIGLADQSGDQCGIGRIENQRVAVENVEQQADLSLLIIGNSQLS